MDANFLADLVDSKLLMGNKEVLLETLKEMEEFQKSEEYTSLLSKEKDLKAKCEELVKEIFENRHRSEKTNELTNVLSVMKTELAETRVQREKIQKLNEQKMQFKLMSSFMKKDAEKAENAENKKAAY